MIDAVRESMDDLAVELRRQEGAHSADDSQSDKVVECQFLATEIETRAVSEKEAGDYHAFLSDPRTSYQTKEATREAIAQLGSSRSSVGIDEFLAEIVRIAGRKPKPKEDADFIGAA